MKKLIYFSVIALCAIALSCTKQETEVTPKPDTPKDIKVELVAELTAFVKSSISGNNPTWGKDDVIYLFGSDSPIMLRMEKKNAPFLNSEKFLGTLKGWSEKEYSFYAVYPHSDAKTLSFDTESLTYSFDIPSTQKQHFKSSGKMDPNSLSFYDRRMSSSESCNIENAKNLKMKFTSLISIIDLEIENKAAKDLKLKKIVLRSNDKIFNLESSFYFKDLSIKDILKLNKEISLELSMSSDDFFLFKESSKEVFRFTSLPFTLKDKLYADLYLDSEKETLYKSIEILTKDEKITNNSIKTFQIQLEPEKIDPSECYIDEYGINHGTGVEIDETIWAPINCGYHSKNYKYGKLYQWGRKVGQDYGDKVEISDNPLPFKETPVDNIFYVGVYKTSHQWMAKNGEEYAFDESTLWEDLNDFGDKIGNPCPEGWRVPKHEEVQTLILNYQGYDTQNGIQGYWFSGSTPINNCGNKKIFLPAGGYRGYSGHCFGINESGCYTTSTPKGTAAYYFGFDSYDGMFAGIGYMGRANGYSLRCVKESKNKE